jgi:hypothetical protein
VKNFKAALFAGMLLASFASTMSLGAEARDHGFGRFGNWDNNPGRHLGWYRHNHWNNGWNNNNNWNAWHSNNNWNTWNNSNDWRFRRYEASRRYNNWHRWY